MNYSNLIKYVRTKYTSCYENDKYYSYISDWLSWYKGYVKSFHTVKVSNGLKVLDREMFRLNMAKRVCEDWASSVLSEQIDIVISSSNNRSSVFVQGGKGFGGVLGSNNFVSVLSEAVEQMFALGSCAIALSLSGIGVDESGKIVAVTDKSRINISHYNAGRVIPISWQNGVVKECAFVSEFVKDNKTYYSLSVHMLDDDGYVIYNDILDDGLNFISYKSDILSVVRTLSQKPFFYILKPNIVNNIDLDSPMGISIYANAIDNIKCCDIAYDSCIREVITGQRIVMMNKCLLTTSDDGTPITPQDVKQTYMQFFGDDAVKDVKEFFKEFHPTLNTDALNKEMQNQLNMLSSKVGFGTKFYNFDIAGGVTATQYVGERNDFIRNSTKMTALVAKTIKDIVSEILFIGQYILKLSVDANAKVDVQTSDGVVEDDKEKREQDRQDVKDGIMSKAEYRAKWYGESLEDAEIKLQKIQ